MRRKRRHRQASRPASRSVPIDEKTRNALLEQRQAFIKKFGREPGPNDPLFFDPDAATPQPVDMDLYEKELAEAMVAAGIDPALIYASTKTGLLVTEENLDKIPAEDLEEWEAAIAEYEELTKAKPS